MHKDPAPDPSSLRPLLTIRDLSKLLKLHRRTIARLCAAGRFPRPMKVGGSSRWKRTDIEQLLNPSEQATGESR